VTTELLLLSNVLASLDLLVARGRVREIDAGDVLRYSPRGR
jgi:hypothetical protein